MAKTGFDAPTYEEALYNFHMDYTSKIRDLLYCLGFDFDKKDIDQLSDNVFGYNYFHVDFREIIPVVVKYRPISQVILNRTPDKAAERVYTNRGSKVSTHTYTHAKAEERRILNGSRNLQGLEISNKFTIGTGEASSVKVENETTISVKAEFEQVHESENTTSSQETDQTEIKVPPGKRVRVTQAKWNAKIEEVDEAYVEFDFGFNLNVKRQWIPHRLDLGGDDYKRRGKYARRIMSVRSLSDLNAILKGISARFPHQKNNLLANKKVANIMRYLNNNAHFVKTEKSTFDDASYGEVEINEENAD